MRQTASRTRNPFLIDRAADPAARGRRSERLNSAFVIRRTVGARIPDQPPKTDVSGSDWLTDEPADTDDAKLDDDD